MKNVSPNLIALTVVFSLVCSLDVRAENLSCRDFFRPQNDVAAVRPFTFLGLALAKTSSANQSSESAAEAANISSHFLAALETIKSSGVDSVRVQEALLLLTTGTRIELTGADTSRVRQQFDLMPDRYQELLKERFLNAVVPRLSSAALEKTLTDMLLSHPGGAGLDFAAFKNVADAFITKLKDSKNSKKLPVPEQQVFAMDSVRQELGHQLVPMLIASDMTLWAIKLIEAGAPLDGVLETKAVAKVSQGTIEIPFEKYANFREMQARIPVISALDLAGITGDMVLFDILLSAGAKPMFYRVYYDLQSQNALYISSVGLHGRFSNWRFYRRLFQKFGFQIPFASRSISPKVEGISVLAEAAIVKDSEMLNSRSRENRADFLLNDYARVILQTIEKAHNEKQSQLVLEMLLIAEAMELRKFLPPDSLKKYLDIVTDSTHHYVR